MAEQVLYKYRSLDNWKFLIDILLSQRLYAASFRSLNDPMEGRYHYRHDEVSQAFDRSIRQSKDYWKICSLTTKPNSTLMWSYYGGGHTGVVIGVAIPKKRGQTIVPVRYDSDVSVGPKHLSRPPRTVALEILSQKQFSWAHEEEVRVFSNAPYVAIKLKSVLVGCQIADADRELITSLVRTVAPRIRVQRVHRSHLDAPIEQFSRARTVSAA